jgi:Oxidoreductase family, NAD-binding Rossmann fold
MSLVPNRSDIRLAMLGMVDGNGHPYSWSAIIGGRYDGAKMAECGYPVIPEYLGAQPPEELGIDGVRVTHIWCDDPEDARKVAEATFIPNQLQRPEDVIGQVDAVIISTDRGEEHIERARPFIEAGLPVFIDKPMCDSVDDLRQFIAWQESGKAILSTSCMRYAKEFSQAAGRIDSLGSLRLITMTMCKSWARYGIHALEGVYPLLRTGGWESVVNSGSERANQVHIRHADQVDVVLSVIDDMYGAFGHMGLFGTEGLETVKFEDTFFAFKTQLVAFVDYLRTGSLPFEFEQTVELMKLVIAGIRSRTEGGRRVRLAEIDAELV